MQIYRCKAPESEDFMREKATIEKEATLEAVSLGIDAKTIPYVLKPSQSDNQGFQIGGTGGAGQQQTNEDALKALPSKKERQKCIYMLCTSASFI